MSTTPDPTRPSSIPPKATSPRSPPLAHSGVPPILPDDPPSEPHQAEEEAAYEDNDDDDDDDNDDEIPYPEPGPQHTLLPPPDFNPFFAIVEDTTTGEHYHPLVHYVFTDDDPAIVTAAAMRSMGLDDTRFLPRPEGAEPVQHLEEEEMEDDGQQEPVVESPLPPRLIGGKEHYLLIDVAADGHTISNAHSMSPDWQITDASVRTAPSFDQEAAGQGYMLRLEGLEMPGRAKGKRKGRGGEGKLKEAQERSRGDIFGALEGLVRGVEGSLAVADRIGMAGRREESGEEEVAKLQSEEVEDNRRNSQLGS